MMYIAEGSMCICTYNFKSSDFVYKDTDTRTHSLTYIL